MLYVSASFDTPSNNNRDDGDEEGKRNEKKRHRSNIFEFLFFLRRVYTCSYLST